VVLVLTTAMVVGEGVLGGLSYGGCHEWKK